MLRARCEWRFCVIALLFSCVSAYTVDCNHEYTDCDNELNKMLDEVHEATQQPTTDITLAEITNIQSIPKIKQATTTPIPEPTTKVISFTETSTTGASDNTESITTDQRSNGDSRIVAEESVLVDPEIETNPFGNRAKPRLLNLSVEDLQSFANALHNKTDIAINPKRITDLSDVNLDDDDEPPKIDYIKTSDNEKAVKDLYSSIHMEYHPLMNVDKISDEREVETDVCKDLGITYKIGEKLERGCEETCECKFGGVFECSPRCKHPYIRRGRRLNDPLCFESPVDDCCAIVACATGNGESKITTNIEICHYDNKTYQVGAKWDVGCEKTCICEKPDKIKCTPRCPPLSSSDKCINVQDPNDSCCEVQVCDVSQDVHEESTEKSTSVTTTPKTTPRNPPRNTPKTTPEISRRVSEDLDFSTSTRPLVLTEPIGSIKVLHNNSVQVNLIHLNDTKDPIHLMLSSDGGKTFFDVELKYDNLILNLDGGRDYILKTRETGTKFNFTITSGPTISEEAVRGDEDATLKEGCYHDGKFYAIGEEFHIGCDELCECTGPEKRECAALLCPAHVGLELVWRGCVRWAPPPPATPPNCCPRSARCLSDGTCHYKGASIPNWSEVPVELTGCEERCFCENGELECQNHCIAPPELPPQSLRCPPHHRPALVNVSDDDCCKEWSCIPNVDYITTSVPDVLVDPFDIEVPTPPYDMDIIFMPRTTPSSTTTSTETPTPVIPPPPESTSPQLCRNCHKTTTAPTTTTITTRTTTTTKGSTSTATTKKVEYTTTPTQNQTSAKKHNIILKPLEESFQNKNLDISLDNVYYPYQPAIQENNRRKQIYDVSDQLIHSLVSDPRNERVSYVYKSEPSLNEPEYILKPEKLVNLNPQFGRIHYFEPFFEGTDIRKQKEKHFISPETNSNPNSKIVPEPSKPMAPYFKPFSFAGNKLRLFDSIPVVISGPHDISKIYFNRVYTRHGEGIYKTLSGPYNKVPESKARNDYIIRNEQVPVIEIPTKSNDSPRRELETKYSALDLDNIMAQMDVDAEINRNLGRSASKVVNTTEAGIPKETQQPKPHPVLPQFLPTIPPVHLPPHDPNDEYDPSPIPRPPHSPLSGPGIPNLHPPPNYGEENKKLSVISIMSDSPTSVKMLFGLPPVLVGLKGSVDLRYTDKLDADIPHWYSQIFAPADEILTTSRLEFRLAGLKPSTTYKIRGKLYLHNLPTEPESDIYTVKTMDLPTIEEKRREIESGLSVVNVNDTAAHVTWKHFTEDELQYIDGIQVRYRVVSSPIYLMTELLHHSRSSAELHELRPGSRYVASLVLVPPPRAVVELYDPIEVEFTTSPYVDPYNWSVTLEAHVIGSQAAEVWWRGVPVPTERWVRVYRAAHSCGGSEAGGLSRVREHDHFRLASRDQPNSITLTGLQPDTRCRIWLELFLTNGKVKTSNVLEINTKPLDTPPHPVDNVIESASVSGSRTGSSSNSGDYYGALVVVGVVAALGALTSLLLLLIVVRRHRPRSVHITSVPSAPRESSLPPYDNPAFKLELQQETMDL